MHVVIAGTCGCDLLIAHAVNEEHTLVYLATDPAALESEAYMQITRHSSDRSGHQSTRSLDASHCLPQCAPADSLQARR
jgi:hypothetical protein